MVEKFEQKVGLYVGRFQPLHKGHEYIIKTALEQCDVLLVCIGSAQESNTPKNPFSYSARAIMLADCFPDEYMSGKLIPIPIKDREHPSDDSSWGEYLIKEIHNYFGYPLTPNIVFEGKEIVRSTWYDTLDIERVALDRTKIDVSGTKIRDALARDDYEYYKNNCASGLGGKYIYNTLRENIKNVKSN